MDYCAGRARRAHAAHGRTETAGRRAHQAPGGRATSGRVYWGAAISKKSNEFSLFMYDGVSGCCGISIPNRRLNRSGNRSTVATSSGEQRRSPGCARSE